MAPTCTKVNSRYFRIYLLSFALFLGNVRASVAQETEPEPVKILIGDKIQRLELNLYVSNEAYTFQLDENSFFCGPNFDRARCTPKLSLSFLKMYCNNETGENFLRIEDQDDRTPEVEELCMNYEYLYTNVHDKSHENLDNLRSTTSPITITTVGNWGYNATKVSLLVSIHYEFSSKCPHGFYDCIERCKGHSGGPQHPKDKSVCIPEEWICDKRPNCGFCEDSDECEDLCDWVPNISETIQYANFFILVLDVFCFGVIPFIVVIVVLKYALRAGQLSRPRRPTEDNEVPYVPRRKSEDPPPSYGEVVVDVPTTDEQAAAEATQTEITASRNDPNNNRTPVATT